MSHGERSNPKRSTWWDHAHRAHKTNGSLWSLWQLAARLKCGPSWTMSSLWIAMPALPCFSQWECLPSLQMVVFTAHRKNSGGFNLELSVGGESAVFPLFPKKRDNPYFFHGTVSLVACCFQVTILQFQPRCLAQAPHGTSVWAPLVLAAAGHQNLTSFKELKLPHFQVHWPPSGLGSP